MSDLKKTVSLEKAIVRVAADLVDSVEPDMGGWSDPFKYTDFNRPSILLSHIFVEDVVFVKTQLRERARMMLLERQAARKAERGL